MRVSIGSVVFSVVTIISILGCGDIAGVGGTVVVGGGDCSMYGETCVGESPYEGAFELAVLPLDDEVTSVTFTVTYKDAIGSDDIVETIEAYEAYPGEFWVWSPSAPPSGYIEVSAYATYWDGVTENLFCSQDEAADWEAYNNMYAVWSDDYYSSSKGCYLKIDLDRIID